MDAPDQTCVTLNNQDSRSSLGLSTVSQSPTQMRQFSWLLALPPEVLGSIWRTNSVLMGISVCKALNKVLPIHVPGISLQNKLEHGSELFERDWSDAIRFRNVVNGLSKFHLTQGLKLTLSDGSLTYSHHTLSTDPEWYMDALPNAGWAEEQVSFSSYSRSVTTRKIYSSEIRNLLENAEKRSMPFNTVVQGIQYVLGQGRLTTLGSLDIRVGGFTPHILSAIHASARTLQSFSLWCRLHPDDVLELGIALQNCLRLHSFEIDGEPEWVEHKNAVISDGKNNTRDRVGAAIIECTTTLLKKCPLLTAIKLVNCSISDDGIEVLATALETGDTLLDLDMSGYNHIGNEGFSHLSRVLARFRTLNLQTWYDLITNTGLLSLKNNLHHATHLKQLTLVQPQEMDAATEESLRAKCHELGINLDLEESGFCVTCGLLPQ